MKKKVQRGENWPTRSSSVVNYRFNEVFYSRLTVDVSTLCLDVKEVGSDRGDKKSLLRI